MVKKEEKQLKNKEKKEEKKESKKERVKEALSTANDVSKPKKERAKRIKPKADKKILAALNKKIQLPAFVGRFGKNWKYTSEKFTKWRKPRGIDIATYKQYTPWPDSGYRTMKKIRHLHPLGFKEILIRNISDAEKISAGSIARIAATVGKKKRLEIIKKLDEKQIWVVNR